MSSTELFKGNRYEIVAWARDQKPILYHEFGSYQGEWLLLAKSEGAYFIYKGYYGSCSGCDSYEATFGYDNEVTKENAIKFINGDKDYKHFLDVPFSTMRNLVEKGTLLQIFPANIRDGYDIDETTLADYVADASGAVKVEEDMSVKIDDILAVKNQEIKQKLLKKYGYEEFLRDSKSEILHEEGDNKLLAVGDILFVNVKDSSTPRRYLLRVPPGMKRVREAIAWTFGMREEQYQPLIET